MPLWCKRFVERYVRALQKRAGVEIFRRRPRYHYVPDYYGCKAEKSIDIRDLAIFGESAKEVIEQKRTLLYYDRLFSIFQLLVDLKRRHGNAEHTNLAEIGVYKGGSSYFIASVVQKIHFPGARVQCFDTFEGHATEDLSIEKDQKRKPSDFSDTEFEEVKSYLSRFENVKVYKGSFQDTCEEVSSGTFHFVHVDVDLYEPTRFILDFFHSRLALGGVFIIDDYGFKSKALPFIE